jgi:hypothetical protein
MENKIFGSVNKILKNKWFHIFVGLATFISIYFYFRNVEEDFSNIFKLNNPHYLLFALPFVLYALVAHVIAWRRIINHYGNHIGFWHALYIYYFSNLSRYIPGNYWHFIFKSTVGVKYGIDLATGLKGTGIELVFNTVVGFGFVILGLACNLIHLEKEQIYWLVLFLVVGIVFYLIFYFLDRINQKNGDNQETESSSVMSKILHELNHSWTFSAKDVLILVFLFASAWIAQGFTFYFVLSAWNISGFSNYLLIMFTYVTAWFLGFINPIAQNGIGVREAIFIVTLSGLFSNAVILGAGIGMRILGLFGELLLLLLGWIMTRGIRKNIQEEN